MPAKPRRKRVIRRERSFLVTVPVRMHVVAPFTKDEAVHLAAAFVGNGLRKHELPPEITSYVLLDPKGEPIRRSGGIHR